MIENEWNSLKAKAQGEEGAGSRCWTAQASSEVLYFPTRNPYSTWKPLCSSAVAHKTYVWRYLKMLWTQSAPSFLAWVCFWFLCSRSCLSSPSALHEEFLEPPTLRQPPPERQQQHCMTEGVFCTNLPGSRTNLQRTDEVVVIQQHLGQVKAKLEIKSKECYTCTQKGPLTSRYPSFYIFLKLSAF